MVDTEVYFGFVTYFLGQTRHLPSTDEGVNITYCLQFIFQGHINLRACSAAMRSLRREALAH